MLSELKIKFDLYESGSNEVISLESLSGHFKECDYNTCIECGLKVDKSEEHNCVNALKSRLILIVAENQNLMNTNRYIMDENVKSIRKLNKKIDVLRKQLIESDVRIDFLIFCSILVSNMSIF